MHNKFGWKFKPFKPTPEMPPSGESWVWRGTYNNGCTLIGKRFDDDLCIQGTDIRLSIERYDFRPIHPYIDPYNNTPTFLDNRIPDEEVCLTDKGWMCRSEGRIWEVKGSSKFQTGYMLHSVKVLARPHAIVALESVFPSILISLPNGVYAQYKGLPTDNHGRLPNDDLHPNGNESMLTDEIDTDDDDNPIIFGTLIGKIGND